MYATFMAIASAHQPEWEGTYGDGINQWAMIRGRLEEQRYRRTQLVYNIDTYTSAIR